MDKFLDINIKKWTKCFISKFEIMIFGEFLTKMNVYFQTFLKPFLRPIIYW